MEMPIKAPVLSVLALVLGLLLGDPLQAASARVMLAPTATIANFLSFIVPPL